jgi:hypothetical protein
VGSFANYYLLLVLSKELALGDQEKIHGKALKVLKRPRGKKPQTFLDMSRRASLRMHNRHIPENLPATGMLPRYTK